MGIENMRRWPMYIVFAICVLLILSLFNSWSMENEVRNKLSEISIQLEECSKQLQDCSKQQVSCMQEFLVAQDQRENFANKVKTLDKEKIYLNNQLLEYQVKLSKTETKVNHTLVDVEFCKTELQSLKNLQLSKSATLETLRLEKETLTSKLDERKKKIEELEKEIERLKSALTTKKSSSNPVAPAKVTPAAQPPKISPPLQMNPINDPALENNAREDLEDTNVVNEGNSNDGNINDMNDFDQQLQ